jgi:hypothetical protein
MAALFLFQEQEFSRLLFGLLRPLALSTGAMVGVISLAPFHQTSAFQQNEEPENESDEASAPNTPASNTGAPDRRAVSSS